MVVERVDKGNNEMKSKGEQQGGKTGEGASVKDEHRGLGTEREDLEID